MRVHVPSLMRERFSLGEGVHFPGDNFPGGMNLSLSLRLSLNQNLSLRRMPIRYQIRFTPRLKTMLCLVWMRIRYRIRFGYRPGTVTGLAHRAQGNWATASPIWQDAQSGNRIDVSPYHRE